MVIYRLSLKVLSSFDFASLLLIDVCIRFGHILGYFLQIDFMYYANTDLLAALSCDREVSHRYILISCKFYSLVFIHCDSKFFDCIDKQV